MDILEMKKAHTLLAEWKYKYSPVDKGYAGQTLYVNISENRFEAKPVTEQMKELFVGGRGFDLWLLWNGTTAETRWDSPENEICISSGPLGGTSSYPGSGKSIATTISPITGSVVDSNVGGHFGPMLKFSGFDAIEIQGKAKEEVIILIDGTNHTVSIETAPMEPIDTHIIGEILTKMYADDPKSRQNISIVSAGTGANHSRMGCLNFSWWDWRRESVRVKQAGRGGIGTVFRNKNIKAMVIKTGYFRPRWKIADRITEPTDK